jgi:hypothetical protein
MRVVVKLRLRLGQYLIYFSNFLMHKPFMPTALEILVENRITGFPVIDDEWKLVRFAYPFL